MEQGEAASPYSGYYYTGDLAFAALAATLDFGGPEPLAGALGARIAVVLETVEGPPGAQFGFWETAVDNVESTNLTWSVSVGLTQGTNQISVSENDGSAGADPYGHKHGRILSVTQPGFYRLGWRFVDVSTNGPAGGPIHAPSDRFFLYLQADVTIAKLTLGLAGAQVSFAAPSNLPDEGTGPATNYQLESTANLAAGAVWKPVGEVVVGDDQLHTVTLPVSAVTGYFRLRTQ